MANESTFAAAAAVQSEWFFNIRPHFNYFERPERAALGAAAKAIFPSDPALGFSEMFGRMAGCYRVVATTQPTVDYVLLKRKIRSETGGFEDVRVPLRPFSSSGGPRRDGTLVTIVDAYHGAARAINGQEFDSAMGAFGEVVMRTKPQVDKETGLLNLNRMVVVDTSTSKNKLPDRLTVGEKSFLIKYKGKQWHCTSCNDMHVGPCPYLKNFYEALDKKRSFKSLDSAIIADSTLRHAEHVGIKADVMAMPGATVGQLANACSDFKGKYKNVFVVGGANDVRVGDVTSEFVIAKRIDRSLKRLVEVASKHNSTQINLFNASPPPKDLSPLEKFSKMYFRDRLKKVFKNLNNVTVLKGVPYSEEWGEDNHPTINCTRDILHGLGTADKELLMDEEYITSERPYRGLEKCWLSGCSGCDMRGSFLDGFCPNCVEQINNHDVYDDFSQLKKLSEKILGDDFPTRKRRHDSNSSNGSDKISAKIMVRNDASDDMDSD